jgi:hypothetical protein
LPFGANAVVINQLGFLFDDNDEQVFSGQTVFWEDEGDGNGVEWQEGALDFNDYSAAAAGSGQIFVYESADPLLFPENIEIWTDSFVNESTQITNSNPTTVSFYVSDNPRKISWARIYSARYWFQSALKKSELHPFG